MQTKKSAVDLSELAIGIVVIGIVVAIGATILTNMASTQVTNLPVLTTANEFVNFTTSTTDTLANAYVKGITNVTDTLTGVVIPSGNYSLTVDSATGIGTISNATATVPGGWNVSYNRYDLTDTRYTLPSNASVGVAEYGNWFKILVIVGVAAVVLALIFMAFGGSRGSSSQSSGGY